MLFAGKNPCYADNNFLSQIEIASIEFITIGILLEVGNDNNFGLNISPLPMFFGFNLHFDTPSFLIFNQKTRLGFENKISFIQSDRNEENEETIALDGLYFTTSPFIGLEFPFLYRKVNKFFDIDLSNDQVTGVFSVFTDFLIAFGHFGGVWKGLITDSVTIGFNVGLQYKMFGILNYSYNNIIGNGSVNLKYQRIFLKDSYVNSIYVGMGIGIGNGSGYDRKK